MDGNDLGVRNENENGNYSMVSSTPKPFELSGVEKEDGSQSAVCAVV